MFKLPNTNFDFKRLLIYKRVTISPVSLSTQLKLSLYFSEFWTRQTHDLTKFCQLVNGNFNKQEISLKPLHERA